MKLSKAQRNIIDDLKEGWLLQFDEIESKWSVINKDGRFNPSYRMNSRTAEALYHNGYIKYMQNSESNLHFGIFYYGLADIGIGEL